MDGHREQSAARFGTGLDALRSTAEHEISVAREKLSMRRAKVESFVLEKPFQALGLALVTGVALGWLLKKR